MTGRDILCRLVLCRQGGLRRTAQTVNLGPRIQPLECDDPGGGLLFWIASPKAFYGYERLIPSARHRTSTPQVDSWKFSSPKTSQRRLFSYLAPLRSWGTTSPSRVM